MTTYLDNFLNITPVSRVRRNHGLEHATIHVLARQAPGRSMAGYSDTGGFWLYGNLPTEVIEAAALEALDRMRNGEHKLAVHPNCGTNFATYGVAAGLASFIAMFGARRWREKLERLPLAMSFSTIALIFAQPIGFLIQEKITTSGHPGGMEIVEVRPVQRGQANLHRIVTRG